MDDPWKVRPATLDEQVERYERQARKLNIKPELLKKYARILIAATKVVAHRHHGEQETRDLVACVAAGEHGILTIDPVKARKAFADARRVQQQVHASAEACSLKLTRFQRLLETRYESLPTNVKSEFPLDKVIVASEVIHGFSKATKPNKTKLAEVKFTQSELSLTAAGHTLLWWREFVPTHKGYWNERYRLAICWKLTKAKDIETFQRHVRKLHFKPDAMGRTYVLRCPPWAIE